MVRSAVYGRPQVKATVKECDEVERRRCPACGGGQTRLVRQSLRSALGNSGSVIVCSSCCHFWAEKVN